MLEKDTIIKVRNRDNGRVGYTIPDLGNLRRVFAPNEVKEVTFEELQKLHYINGGDYIIKNCLLIDNEEAINSLFEGETIEPEYFYTENDVKNLLLNSSLDEFLDCLDFAPAGVIELVKDLAVKLEINDIQKREAIFKKTGFNVNSAIDFNKEVQETEEDSNPKRRVAASKEEQATPTAPTRRVTEGKYKVVTK